MEWERDPVLEASASKQEHAGWMLSADCYHREKVVNCCSYQKDNQWHDLLDTLNMQTVLLLL